MPVSRGVPVVVAALRAVAAQATVLERTDGDAPGGRSMPQMTPTLFWVVVAIGAVLVVVVIAAVIRIVRQRVRIRRLEAIVRNSGPRRPPRFVEPDLQRGTQRVTVHEPDYTTRRETYE
ncbi:Uncharacterized protein PBTT_01882 [Plasmodiophora brassicae]